MKILLSVIFVFLTWSSAKAEKIDIYQRIHSLDCEVNDGSEESYLNLVLVKEPTNEGIKTSLKMKYTYVDFMTWKTFFYVVKTAHYDDVSKTFELVISRNEKLHSVVILPNGKGSFSKTGLYSCSVRGAWNN